MADEVQNSMQIFCRIRAFFSTLAYISIHEPDWFPLQDLIFTEDKFFDLLQWTKDKRRPPLSHFITAWALTLRFMSDEVRTNGRKLGSLVRETSSWQSAWTCWSPPATTTTVASASAGSSDRVRDLEKQLADKRREAQRLQSERDRLATSISNKGGGRGSDDRGLARPFRRGDYRQEGKRESRPEEPQRKKGNRGKGSWGDTQHR